MNEQLEKLWKEAADNPGVSVDIGRIVVCDSCNEDFTDSLAIGGFIWGSKACCPSCAPRLDASLKRYGETHYIRARCPDLQAFADFVRAYRGGNNCITIHGPAHGSRR